MDADAGSNVIHSESRQSTDLEKAASVKDEESKQENFNQTSTTQDSTLISGTDSFETNQNKTGQDFLKMSN